MYNKKTEMRNLIKKDFSKLQTETIEKAFKEKMKMSKITVFASPKYSGRQMQEIMEAFKMNATKKEVSLLTDPLFTWEQMREIRLSLHYCASLKEVRMIAQLNFTSGQMECLRHAFNYMSFNEVKIMAQQKFSPEKMRILMQHRILKRVPGLFDEWQDVDFNYKQRKQIKLAIGYGHSKEEINAFAYTDVKARDMKKAINLYGEMKTMEDVENFIKSLQLRKNKGD